LKNLIQEYNSHLETFQMLSEYGKSLIDKPAFADENIKVKISLFEEAQKNYANALKNEKSNPKHKNIETKSILNRLKNKYYQ
jgi:hypothetical protein